MVSAAWRTCLVRSLTTVVCFASWLSARCALSSAIPLPYQLLSIRCADSRRLTGRCADGLLHSWRIDWSSDPRPRLRAPHRDERVRLPSLAWWYPNMGINNGSRQRRTNEDVQVKARYRKARFLALYSDPGVLQYLSPACLVLLEFHLAVYQPSTTWNILVSTISNRPSQGLPHSTCVIDRFSGDVLLLPLPCI